MKHRRAVTLGSGLLFAASLVPVAVAVSRSFEQRVSARPPVERPSQPADPALIDVVEQAKRLRTYASTAPAPHQPARNPFRFAPVTPKVDPAVRTPGAASVAAPSAAPSPVVPLSLIGMAERRSAGTPGDGVERVAILAGPDDVYLVGVGDRVADRFTVVGVGAEAVELRDEATDRVLRLGLR